MELKWKESIIIALISVIIGYLLHGYVSLGSLELPLINGVWLGLSFLAGLLGGSDIVGLISNYFREKREKRDKQREKLEGYVHIHNQEMVEKIFKYWFYGKETINEERQRTIEHLEIGYSDIWKLECEREEHKKHFLESETAIREKIKDKLKKYAPFEWDLDSMQQLLYKAVENFSIKGGTDDDFKTYIHNFQRFGIRQMPDKNDNYLTGIQENFRKLVDDIVADKTIVETAKFASNERKFFDEKIEKFKQDIESIKHDFEKRHIELKGTCNDCKDWHDELESLK